MDKYLELDELTGEYVITHQAVSDFIDAQPAELTKHFDDEGKAYRAISQAVYRLIYNAYQGINAHNHIKFMKYKIQRNHENEKSNLMQAIIEMVRGALVSDMDLNEYYDVAAKHYPPSVVAYLKAGRLIMPGEKHAP